MNNNLTYRLTLKDFFRRTMQGAADDTRRLDGGMNRLNSTINRAGRAFMGYFAAERIGQFATDVVKSTAAMQSFNNTIMAGGRTEAEGANNLRFINSEIDRLHLNLKAAQGGYKTFSGAVMGTNIQGEKANKIFSQVAAASTVLGLSAEQTEGSFLALGQMISKGTVQAEELRGQLAERIPGAFQIGARAMGMTTKQLGDAMKDGLISSEEFLVKFGDELERTFGDKLGVALNSTQSKLNDMETAWERLMVNIGNSQSGVINSTVSFLGQMTNALSKYFADANIMTANFTAQGAKDFGFWAKGMHEYIGMGSGYNFGYSPIVEQENFQRDVYSRFVDKQPKNIQEALGNKMDLYKMSIEKDRELKRGDIDMETAQRFQATITGALKIVNQTIAGFKLNKAAPTDLGGIGKDKKAVPALGSATEVFGSRPQNINVTINGGLVHHQEIHAKTLTESAEQVKASVVKPLLEALNDVNQVSTR